MVCSAWSCLSYIAPSLARIEKAGNEPVLIAPRENDSKLSYRSKPCYMLILNKANALTETAELLYPPRFVEYITVNEIRDFDYLRIQRREPFTNEEIWLIGISNLRRVS